MKLVKEYSNEAEAYIDKGLLESNDIDSVVTQSAMSDIFPAPDAGTGVVGLYVPDTDYKKAYDLLSGGD